MIFKRILPDMIVRPFIDHYLYIKDNEKLNFMFLPDNINVLTFQLAGNTNAQYAGMSCSNIKTRISGAFTDKRYFETSGTFEVIMVFMKPFAIYSLFSINLHNFKNQIISLSDVVNQSDVAELNQKINEQNSIFDKIKIIEAFFKSIYLENADFPMRILEALELIHSKSGLISSQMIANSLNVSQRTLERLFNQVLGVNVKEYSSLIRLKTAVNHLKDFSFLTDVAYDAEFFDQSHFNRFFKKYTGISPGRFVKTDLSNKQVVDFLQLYVETVE